MQRVRAGARGGHDQEGAPRAHPGGAEGGAPGQSTESNVGEGLRRAAGRALESGIRKWPGCSSAGTRERRPPGERVAHRRCTTYWWRAG